MVPVAVPVLVQALVVGSLPGSGARLLAHSSRLRLLLVGMGLMLLMDHHRIQRGVV